MRIWRVKPAEDNDDAETEGEPRWTGTVVADFDHHKFVHISFLLAGRVDHSSQIGGWPGRMEYNRV